MAIRAEKFKAIVAVVPRRQHADVQKRDQARHRRHRPDLKGIGILEKHGGDGAHARRLSTLVWLPSVAPDELQPR